MRNIIFNDLKRYLKTVLSREQAQTYLEEMNQIEDTPSKYFDFLSRLPDSYIFYAVGLLDYTQMRQIENVSRRLFKENAFNTFKAISPHLSKQDRQEFLALYNEKPIVKLKLLDKLEELDVNKEDLLQLEPSIQDVLAYMFNNDFELYKPLLSRFNAKIITDAQRVKELLGCIAYSSDSVENETGYLETISAREDSENELDVCINRLTVLSTAYDIMGHYGKEDETVFYQFQKAYAFILANIFKNIHQNLESLHNNEDVHKRVNAFYEVIAESFDLTETDIHSVEQLHQTIFDITNRIKPVYYSVFNSKQDYYFYTQWFNDSLDFTPEESAHILPLRQTKTFKNQPISIDEVYQKHEHLISSFLLTNETDETLINRALFGAVQTSDILYLTGYLSSLEYSIAQNVEVRYLESDQNSERLISFYELQQQLSEESYPIYIQFSNDDLQFFNSLLSVGGIYYALGNPIDNLEYQEEPFNLSRKEVKEFFIDGSLNAEMKMTELIVAELKKFSTECLEESKPILLPLLDAYWGETIHLFDRAQQSQNVPLVKKQMKVNKEILGECKNPFDFSQRLNFHLKMIDYLRGCYLAEYQKKPHVRNKKVLMLDNCMNFFLAEFSKSSPQIKKKIFDHQNTFDINLLVQNIKEPHNKE